MLMLRAVYPCGLHDLLGEQYDKDDTHALLGNKSTSLDFVFRFSQSDSLSSYEFLIKLKHHLNHNYQTFLIFLEYLIRQLITL